MQYKAYIRVNCHWTVASPWQKRELNILVYNISMYNMYDCRVNIESERGPRSYIPITTSLSTQIYVYITDTVKPL